MAKLFLEAGDFFPIAAAVQAFGAASTTQSETVTLLGNPSGVELDANIERVEFENNAADYSYAITGNKVDISLAGSVVVSIILGNPVKLAMADGSADLLITGLGAATFGGVALSGTSLNPTLDSNDKSSIATATDTTTTPVVFTLANQFDASENEVQLAGVNSYSDTEYL